MGAFFVRRPIVAMVISILILLLVTGLVSCKSGGGKEPDTDPTRSGPSMPDATSGDTTAETVELDLARRRAIEALGYGGK